jgi:16S rRNA (cytidine1402-2'-O)-methyltransferase
MTKMHQEVLRGAPEELSDEVRGRGTLKGEVTLVIGPPSPDAQISQDEITAKLSVLLRHHSASKAASLLARETSMSKADLYNLAVDLKALQK